MSGNPGDFGADSIVFNKKRATARAEEILDSSVGIFFGVICLILRAIFNISVEFYILLLLSNSFNRYDNLSVNVNVHKFQ